MRHGCARRESLERVEQFASAGPKLRRPMVVDDRNQTRHRAIGNDLAWRVDSVCRQHPTQWWFAGGPRDVARQVASARGCAVQSACLEFALVAARAARDLGRDDCRSERAVAAPRPLEPTADPSTAGDLGPRPTRMRRNP